MVSKKHIRWSLLLPWVMMAFALIGVVLYLAVPAILSALTGLPDACSYQAAGKSGQVAIGVAMADLCNTSQTFLGVAIMAIIIFSGLASVLSMILVSADIVQKQDMEGLHKALWLGAIWLVLGYFAAAAYYFMVKQKESDPVE